jgi:hypothetical protein
VAEIVEPESMQPTRSGHRLVWLSAGLLFLAAVLVTGVALSMWRPATFPRPRVLPEPGRAEFEDSCGRGVERFWEEGALFWEHTDFVDAIPCPGDSIGDP